MVERAAVNRMVAGSSPALPAIFFNRGNRIMILVAAVAAEFETNEGLLVQVELKVTDEQGIADAAAADILHLINSYVEAQNDEEPIDAVLDGGGYR